MLWIISFGALVAVANAGLYHGAGQETSTQRIVRNNGPSLPVFSGFNAYAPLFYSGHYAVHAPYYGGHNFYANPKYGFPFSGAETGDQKPQHESRDGDAELGYFSMVQPDGVVRQVVNTEKDHSGFNTIVHNAPPIVHPHPLFHPY